VLAKNAQAKQLEIYEQIVKHKLSVRQTEALVKNLKNPISIKQKSTAVQSIFVKQIESDFKAILGKAVSVKSNTSGKGKIEIKFSDEAELERLKKLLL